MACYARSMTARDVQAQPQQMYRMEVVSPLISNVADAVIEETKTWQHSIESLYPTV